MIFSPIFYIFDEHKADYAILKWQLSDDLNLVLKVLITAQVMIGKHKRFHERIFKTMFSFIILM
jgi:hypothetical protein